MGIKPGTAVIVVLQSPREKCFGIIQTIDTTGVFIRGLDLNSFDEWLHAIVHGEEFVGVGDLFLPMWRVERISRDEASGGIPSLCEQVEKRTGRTPEEVFS